MILRIYNSLINKRKAIKLQQLQQQRVIDTAAMDSTDIPAEVFHNFFVQPEKSSRDVGKLIVEWNQSYDPSFNIVKAQFRKFADKTPTNAQFLCCNVIKTIQMLIQCKCPRNFMRAYLATIKSILEEEKPSVAKQILNNHLGQYTANWKQVNIEVLQAYFDAFSLKNKVSQQQVNEFIQKMIQNKKYNKCLDFIKYLGVGENKDNIQKLMTKMSNKKDASKAADIVKQLKLDPKNYPALGERLYKNTARHFLTKHGWEYAQQIFEEYPEALVCIVEDLIYKKKIPQARSIWSRHPLWQYLQKDQSKQVLKEEYKGEILDNPLICNDRFGPPNDEKYISLSNFGIKEEDVIWVDNQTKQLDQILNDILSAQLLGIDTESIVGQTKFEKVDQAAIIQVSTGKKIYIFDGFKSNTPRIANVFFKCFEQKKIIGHSFSNDVEGMVKGLGLPENQDIKIKNLVDICKVYKGLDQNAKYSSLAHICKQVFRKQLCKDQTLTNWKRRPLRKNQIHYAALDAHVVVQVYKAWIKQYGMIVHYHANLDDDQL